MHSNLISTPLLSIGIMTGNSLDAADAVLTAFYPNGEMIDLAFHCEPNPEWLYHALKDLRQAIEIAQGNMDIIATQYYYQVDDRQYHFDDVLMAYMQTVLKTVQGLIEKARQDTALASYDLSEIDLIGFHGQTCAHCPPSMASSSQSYTIQIGDAQWLANQTGITTIYDFRSDDLMHGGEAAPLIPAHHRHMARHLKRKRALPITFINAGNTSNLTHITYNQSGEIKTLGWDAGPFNHLPDALMRVEKKMPFDKDGKLAKKGKVNLELLNDLFEHAASTANGENFLLQPPPKSSDPTWYHLDCLMASPLRFENKLRTALYFSAYLTYHSLGFTSEELTLPSRFAVFGGGWKNKVVLSHFQGLLKGDFTQQPVLPQHLKHFENIQTRLQQAGPVSLVFSNEYGFDANAMEARLFADMARCRILTIPFSYPEITGVNTPTVCGLIAYPDNNPARASHTLQLWQGFGNEDSLQQPAVRDSRWSRAAAGWQKIKQGIVSSI